MSARTWGGYREFERRDNEVTGRVLTQRVLSYQEVHDLVLPILYEAIGWYDWLVNEAQPHPTKLHYIPDERAAFITNLVVRYWVRYIRLWSPGWSVVDELKIEAELGRWRELWRGVLV